MKTIIIPICALWLLSACAGSIGGPSAAAPADTKASSGVCAPPGQWFDPASMAPIRSGDLLARAARRGVVLLGEDHTNYDHHRWQLHTIAALHALNPNMALAFESFPRRVQPALDRWTRGELNEDEFL
ncbi:MAG: ChaN family lipoprotein, partial [Rhodospirillales bacterium]